MELENFTKVIGEGWRNKRNEQAEPEGLDSEAETDTVREAV